MHCYVFLCTCIVSMYVCMYVGWMSLYCINVSHDEWCLVDLQDISSFSYILWENPSLLNPYDIIGDIISTHKCYISRSIEFYDIQHG